MHSRSPTALLPIPFALAMTVWLPACSPHRAPASTAAHASSAEVPTAQPPSAQAPSAQPPAVEFTSVDTRTAEPPSDSEESPPEAASQPIVLVPASGPLRLQVKVEPGDTLSVDDARDFYLSIDVANPSRGAIQMDLRQSRLLVNGKPLKQWKGTVSELPTDGKWRELLPGQSVHFLFKFASKVKVAPGEYGFVMHVGNSNSATVKLTVRP